VGKKQKKEGDKSGERGAQKGEREKAKTKGERGTQSGRIKYRGGEVTATKTAVSPWEGGGGDNGWGGGKHVGTTQKNERGVCGRAPREKKT